MKTAPSDSGQRAKCVGWKTGAEIAVPHPARITPSRDGHPIQVQPGHHLAQWHRRQTVSPESCKIHRPTHLGKPRPQPKTEGLTAFLQPSPPAARRVAIHPALPSRLMQRATPEQPQQHRLLNRPVIPTPRRDALGQPRTGLAAALTKEPRDRNRVQRATWPRPSICLALITAAL
jgi:hypothetical protein